MIWCVCSRGYLTERGGPFMRCLFLVFLLLTNVHWAVDVEPGRGDVREECGALKGLEKFDVTLFYDEEGESKIYSCVVDAFRKLGKTSVSETGSLIADFMRG